MRHCPACTKELVRHEGEKHAHFLKRKYCDWDCSVNGRALIAEAKRKAQDLADHDDPDPEATLNFDRGEIIRAGHMAAPQIPVSLIDDVIRAVEPLIASNTRHRLLHRVAVQYRVDHL